MDLKYAILLSLKNIQTITVNAVINVLSCSN